MSSKWEYSLKYLKAIEKKHKDFFSVKNLKILDCVEVKGDHFISVHIINPDLPLEIQKDIENMFWQE